MTKAQKFQILADLPAVKADPMLSEFIAHEMELLAKKNTAEKKPTAQQEANAGIKDAVLAMMQEHPNQLYTVTDIIKAVPACADLTNQRVSALIRQMVDAGLVKRTEDKRKAYFSLA
jgi:hypothetical protein